MHRIRSAVAGGGTARVLAKLPLIATTDHQSMMYVSSSSSPSSGTVTETKPFRGHYGGHIKGAGAVVV